jgi:hypothetical protein
MTQLTKEHLDKALDKHFKKVDHRFEKIDSKFAAQTKELKAYTQQEIAELARMVKEGFDSVQQQLDVRDEVNQLKVKVARISQAIGLSK